MRKKIWGLILCICVLLLSNNLILAQNTPFPTVIDEGTALPVKASNAFASWGATAPFVKGSSQWPAITSSSSYQVTNPFLNYSTKEFFAATPWSAQTGYNLNLNTYSGWSGTTFSTDFASSAGPAGSTTSFSQLLDLPQVTISSYYSDYKSVALTGWGVTGTYGVTASESVSGKITPWTGTHPQLEAVNILQSMVPGQISATDRVLAENAVYIGGQKVYLTSGYVNPYSTSKYYYPEYKTSTTSKMTTVNGFPVAGSVYGQSYTPQGSYVNLPTYTYGFPSTDYRVQRTTTGETPSGTDTIITDDVPLEPDSSL
ncbi:MAG: hypothetical protein ACMUJM_26135 [bacterium]